MTSAVSDWITPGELPGKVKETVASTPLPVMPLALTIPMAMFPGTFVLETNNEPLDSSPWLTVGLVMIVMS